MKKALLIASFGSTVAAARQELAALEQALAAAAPGWQPARAYTSGMVRRALAAQGTPVDSPAEALARLKAAGVEEVFVQPTHLVRGAEYEKLAAEAEAAAGGFARLRVGRPLLESDREDGLLPFMALNHVLRALYPQQEGRAVVLMGHGAAGPGGRAYQAMQRAFEANRLDGYCVGTVEGTPGFEEVRAWLRARPWARRVQLAPLMVLAGQHVLQDMAGEGPGSWKSRLEADGYEVSCTMHGLAAEAEVRAIYAARLQAALAGKAFMDWDF